MSRAWTGGMRKTKLYHKLLVSTDTNPLEDTTQDTNIYRGAVRDMCPTKEQGGYNWRTVDFYKENCKFGKLSG